jgi:sorting nexin-29
LKEHNNIIKNKNGELLTTERECNTRWAEYCSELYNYNINVKADTLDNLWPNEHQDELPSIMESEVTAALKKLKNRKAPGVDGLEGELIKMGGQASVKVMHKICNRIWTSGQFPTLWTKSLIVTLPKKGDTTKCENYRTISLICHASKIILEIIRSRMKSTIETQMAEEQAGFRAGRGTIEQIFAIRLLAEKYLDLQDKDLYLVFIDFKKAFDRVWHEGLWRVLHHYGVHPKIVELIKNLYAQTTSAVRVGSTDPIWFRQTVGVRQGCILSPDLFNIFLEHIMRLALDEEHGNEDDVTVSGRPINNLRFADDIALLAKSLRRLQDLINKVNKVSSDYGMEISETKTEWMLTSLRPKEEKQDTIDQGLRLGNERLNYTERFKYLGSYISEFGESTQDIRVRTACALSTMNSLKDIWSDKKIRVETKMRLYRSLIQPIALYGCETWTLRAKEESMLNVFEMAALRKIAGVKLIDKIRNEAIREQLGQRRTIVNEVHERQNRWLGHVLRMDGNRIPITTLEGRVEGVRRQGRPRTSWTQSVIKRTGLSWQNARNLAQDRVEWRSLSRRVGEPTFTTDTV